MWALLNCQGAKLSETNFSAIMSLWYLASAVPDRFPATWPMVEKLFIGVSCSHEPGVSLPSSSSLWRFWGFRYFLSSLKNFEKKLWRTTQALIVFIESAASRPEIDWPLCQRHSPQLDVLLKLCKDYNYNISSAKATVWSSKAYSELAVRSYLPDFFYNAGLFSGVTAENWLAFPKFCLSFNRYIGLISI